MAKHDSFVVSLRSDSSGKLFIVSLCSCHHFFVFQNEADGSFRHEREVLDPTGLAFNQFRLSRSQVSPASIAGAAAFVGTLGGWVAQKTRKVAMHLAAFVAIDLVTKPQFRTG